MIFKASFFNRLISTCSGDGSDKGVVINATAYDGTLERACLALNLPVLSLSDVMIHHQYTTQSISTFLLDEWKRGAGQVGKITPRYCPQPPRDQQPEDVPEPSLAICKIDGNKLNLSAETRSLYITDPVRAPEWRQMLKAFDEKWQADGNPVQESQAAGATVVQSVVPADPEDEDAPLSGSDPSGWEDVFPNEPRTKEEVENKYGAGCHTFPVTNQITGLVVEGPKLFFIASADTDFDTDQPVLCFGGGTWLLDAKAQTFMEDRVDWV